MQGQGVLWVFHGHITAAGLGIRHVSRVCVGIFTRAARCVFVCLLVRPAGRATAPDGSEECTRVQDAAKAYILNLFKSKYTETEKKVCLCVVGVCVLVRGALVTSVCRRAGCWL